LNKGRYQQYTAEYIMPGMLISSKRDWKTISNRYSHQ